MKEQEKPEFVARWKIEFPGKSKGDREKTVKKFKSLTKIDTKHQAGSIGTVKSGKNRKLRTVIAV